MQIYAHDRHAFATRALGGLPEGLPFPSVDVTAVQALLSQCPIAKPTPLIDATALARILGIARLSIKDERNRMGLGSFKALGAAYAIARDAKLTGAADLSKALAGRVYVTASAGNHGLSVAAGARIFGAQSCIYIAESVPASFEQRLAEAGAQVRREGRIYEESMAAAERAGQQDSWHLLSDSAWVSHIDPAFFVMEGYLAMAEEAHQQIAAPPTHIFLQAGVGGLAGAVAAYARHVWSDAPKIVVVEPDAAPALQASVQAGAFTPTTGPVSNMGRLDCKEASWIALKGLYRDADFFVTLSDEFVEKALVQLADHALNASPSGAAGVAALFADETARSELGLDASARALCILSEGPAA